MIKPIFKAFTIAAVAALALTSLPLTAKADSVVKEMVGFRDVEVKLGEAADDCYLDGQEEAFKAALIEKLKGAGLPQTDKSFVTVAMSVTNTSFGLLDAECAVHVLLSFQTFVPQDKFICLPEAQEAALIRLGGLPTNLYTLAGMAVTTNDQPSGGGASSSPSKMVLQIVDSALDKFEAERQSP